MFWVGVPSKSFIAGNGGGGYLIKYTCKTPANDGSFDSVEATHDSYLGNVQVSRADAKRLVRFTHLVRDCKGIPEHALPGLEVLVDRIEERALERRS